MLFDKCNGSKQQGNIGHAAALFYYSSLGWNVSNPITDCTDYDFLAEDNGKIYKVEDKNNKDKSKKNKELFSFIKHICKNKSSSSSS